MERVRPNTQAYSQAPWRLQLQIIVVFLLTLVSVALIAGIYLNISARKVALGHQVQDHKDEVESLERSIADLQTQLAYLKSTETMRERAEELGFEPVQPKDIMYVLVPGYLGRQEARLAPPPGPVRSAPSALSPAYTMSLVEWLAEKLFIPDDLMLSRGMP